jgi:hypothetical protein
MKKHHTGGRPAHRSYQVHGWVQGEEPIWNSNVVFDRAVTLEKKNYVKNNIVLIFEKFDNFPKNCFNGFFAHIIGFKNCSRKITYYREYEIPACRISRQNNFFGMYSPRILFVDDPFIDGITLFQRHRELDSGGKLVVHLRGRVSGRRMRDEDEEEAEGEEGEEGEEG